MKSLDTDRNHYHAVLKASKRRRVVRYEHVGSKIVKVVYTLVHSNNDRERMQAGERSQELQQRVNQGAREKRTLKIAEGTEP